MMQKMMPVMMREMIPERKSYFQDSVHTHIHLEVMDYAFQFFINLEATKHKQTWASIRFSVKWNIGLVSIVPLDILKARSTTHRPLYCATTSLGVGSVLVTYPRLFILSFVILPEAQAFFNRSTPLMRLQAFLEARLELYVTIRRSPLSSLYS